MMPDVLSIALGAAMIVTVLVDIFETLFNPQRVGSPSQRLLDAIWLRAVASRQISQRGLVLVGPLFILTVFVLWLCVTVLGWALIYHVYLPGDSTSLSVGMAPDAQAGIVDAVYFSAVVQTTLGFGDITPRSDLLRLLVPLQAGVGFVMLTAGITWVLGIYPALVRRQRFTHLLYALQRQLGTEGFAHHSLSESEIPTIARELADHLTTVLSDLLQFPITFYFHSHELKFSLPDALLYLPVLVDGVAEDGHPQRHSASLGLLGHALQDFCESIETRFPLNVDGDDVLEAFARTAGYTDGSTRWSEALRNRL